MAKKTHDTKDHLNLIKKLKKADKLRKQAENVVRKPKR